MALALYDRVQETTTTTGTGTITLAGAVAGFQSFAVVGNGNTTYYCITSGTAWEVGLGTYSTSGPTLARTTVYSNSLGTTSPISLTGTSNVFVTLPAEQYPGTTYTRTSFTASASQTTFTITYTVGFIEVYVNGVLLNASDYTASNGTSVVLAVACNSGDIVEFIAFNATSLTGTSRVVTDFTATASQTTFSVSYTPGAIDVYRNGVKLATSDYTATNGTSVVLGVACKSGDVVQFVAFNITTLTSSVRSVTDFTATAGQTTFSTTYTVGYVDVYRNGSKLTNSDYTATNGTSIVLGNTCTSGDIVEIVTYTPTLVNPVAGGTGNQVQYNSSGGLAGSANLTFDGTYLSSNTGLVPGELIYRLNTAYTGTATTSAQSFLGVGVTVSGSTVYQFEGLFAVSKTATASAHNFQLGFGGTATINNIAYEYYQPASAITSFNDTTNGAVYTGFIQVATATTIAGPSAATVYKTVFMKGTVSVNAGGTFIPQYTTSVSVGPYTTQIGSYFKLSPIGASGANTSIGTWA